MQIEDHARQVPGNPVPTAKDVNTSGNRARRSLTLLFDTPDTPTAVELPLPLVGEMVSQIAQQLADSDGAADIRGAAEMFTIRDVSAVLVGQVPALRYEVEAGLSMTTTLDHAAAVELHAKLGLILEHLGQLKPTRLN